MKFKTISGIILTSVCNHYFLVSAKETVEVNETAAFYWKLLQCGASRDELKAAVKETYEVTNEDLIISDISDFLHSLLEKRFIVRDNS